MIQKYNCLNLILLFFALSGCGSVGVYSLLEESDSNLRSYNTIEILEIESGETTDIIERGTKSQIRESIKTNVKTWRLFDNVVFNTPTTKNTLQIKCKIVELDNGSEFLRFVISLGVGKAYLKTHCEFIDKEKNEVINSGEFSGEMRGGLFGSSADQKVMAKYVGEAVSDFLRKGNSVVAYQ